jgi:aminoglycoside phosphotransferase (APT) family kinase protein
VIARVDTEPASGFAAVVTAIEPDGRLLEISPLAGGLSSQSTMLLVENPGGDHRRLTVRQLRSPHADRNSLSLADQFRLLVVLYDRGLPVPAPVHYDGSGRIFAHPYAVFEYIEGTPRVTTADPEGTGRMFADQLAAIHRLGLGQVMSDVGGANAAIDAGSLDLSVRIDQVRRYLATPPVVLDDAMAEGRVRQALERHWPPPEPERSVLLHGDFWAGNVLWRHDEIVGVLDWEEAGRGDPLIDVAVTRLDLLWAFGPRSMQAFTDHYLSRTAIDPAALPLWDLAAALRPIGNLSLWAADWAAFGRPEVTAAGLRADHRWFVDQALDAVGS